MGGKNKDTIFNVGDSLLHVVISLRISLVLKGNEKHFL